MKCKNWFICIIETDRNFNLALISSGNEEDNRRVLLWLQLIAASFLVIGVSIKIYVKCKRICVDDLDPEIICYLCEKKVALSEWNDKANGHRNYCIVKSKDCRGRFNSINKNLFEIGEYKMIWLRKEKSTNSVFGRFKTFFQF